MGACMCPPFSPSPTFLSLFYTIPPTKQRGDGGEGEGGVQTAVFFSPQRPTMW